MFRNTATFQGMLVGLWAVAADMYDSHMRWAKACKSAQEGTLGLKKYLMCEDPMRAWGYMTSAVLFCLLTSLPRLQFVPERDVSAHQVLRGCPEGFVGVSLLKRGPGAQTTFGHFALISRTWGKTSSVSVVC